MHPQRRLEVCDSVVFVDSLLGRHNALVVRVIAHEAGARAETTEPDCNLAFVSTDPLARDTYGRQTMHARNVMHRSNQPRRGAYWAWPDEIGLPD